MGSDITRQPIGRGCRSLIYGRCTCAPKRQTENKKNRATPPSLSPNANPVSLSCASLIRRGSVRSSRLHRCRGTTLLHKPQQQHFSSNICTAAGRAMHGRIFFSFFSFSPRNIKILNDCSASDIWQGLHVNHGRREAALRLDGCCIVMRPPPPPQQVFYWR